MVCLLVLIVVVWLAWRFVARPYMARWNSTKADRNQAFAGVEALKYYKGDVVHEAVRAIDIQAKPEEVWPWLAQVGRGGGLYGEDAWTNMRKASANRLVEWIPAPALGDATPLGYLLHLEEGRSLGYWAPGTPELGGVRWEATTFVLTPQGSGTRLVKHHKLVVSGGLARLAGPWLRIRDFLDTVKQLSTLKNYIEGYETRKVNGEIRPFEGKMAYQFDEVCYADGQRAGVEGAGPAKRFREMALRDGILNQAAAE